MRTNPIESSLTQNCCSTQAHVALGSLGHLRPLDMWGPGVRLPRRSPPNCQVCVCLATFASPLVEIWHPAPSNPSSHPYLSPHTTASQVFCTSVTLIYAQPKPPKAFGNPCSSLLHSLCVRKLHWLHLHVFPDRAHLLSTLLHHSVPDYCTFQVGSR